MRTNPTTEPNSRHRLDAPDTVAAPSARMDLGRLEVSDADTRANLLDAIRRRVENGEYLTREAALKTIAAILGPDSPSHQVD